MSIKSWLQSLWPFNKNPEKRIIMLLQQLDSAIEDLKIKTAESLAREADLRRKIAAEMTVIESSDQAKNAAAMSHVRERVDFLTVEMTKEEKATQRLKEIFADLHNKKKSMELSFQQSLARRRNADTLNLIASLHKDFGEDMKLNTYLSKFSEESFKIEFTADSRLKVETIIDNISET